MTHFKALIETDYLGQWDLPSDRDTIVVIDKVQPFVPSRRKDGEKQKRVEITFRRARKHWLAGPVCQAIIADMYGNHVENWIGKAIALYVDPHVKFGKKTTGGVRVRPTIPRRPETTHSIDRPVDEAKAAELALAREQAEAERALGGRESGVEA